MIWNGLAAREEGAIVVTAGGLLGRRMVPLCAVCTLSQGYMSQVPRMILEKVVENEGAVTSSRWSGRSSDFNSASLHLAGGPPLWFVLLPALSMGAPLLRFLQGRVRWCGWLEIVPRRGSQTPTTSSIPRTIGPWFPPLQRAQGWGTLSRGEHNEKQRVGHPPIQTPPWGIVIVIDSRPEDVGKAWFHYAPSVFSVKVTRHKLGAMLWKNEMPRIWACKHDRLFQPSTTLLSLLRSLRMFPRLGPHGLRRGLHSFAAARLGPVAPDNQIGGY